MGLLTSLPVCAPFVVSTCPTKLLEIAHFIHGRCSTDDNFLYQTSPHRTGLIELLLATELKGTRLLASTEYFAHTSVEGLRNHIEPLNNGVFFHQGLFPDSLPDALFGTRYCFVHLDADLYAPTMAGLEHFYPRLSPGAIMVVHDFNAWPGPHTAVVRFFVDKPELQIPMADHSGSVVTVKN